MIFTKGRIIGFLVAATLYLVTWAVTREALAALTLGIVIELIALIIDLHVSIESEFRRYGRAAKLQQLLQASGPDAPDLNQYVSDYVDVTKVSHPLLAQHAREQAVQSVDEMRALKEGRLTVGPSLVQLKGTEILRDLKVSGFATALGHLYDFWLSDSRSEERAAVAPAGEDSAEAGDAPTPVDMAEDQPDVDKAKRDYQRAAIDVVVKRKVPITRVFILEKVSLPQAFVDLIDAQSRAGVTVLVAFSHDLDSDLRHDFGIWDDKLVVYVNWLHTVVRGPGGAPFIASTVTGATYHTSQAELIKARRMRDRIIRKADDWKEVRSSLIANSPPK